ncbi:MAG: 1,4-alpha-glucan branching protein GlgB [Lentisphaeraceae bacterium]|nr:1,4-alpha-glucan branching protein GlgB [Lentisphaeraceae bacterium]
MKNKAGKKSVSLSAYLSEQEKNDILYARTSNPHSILGMHSTSGGFIYRVFDPYAKSINIIIDEKEYKMEKVDPNGFFLYKRNTKKPGSYRLKKEYDSETTTSHDPYSFLPAINDFDLHLFCEGRNQELYKMLGSSVLTINEVQGSRFVVWAPNAQRVSVIGNFNSWDGRRNIMRTIGSSGLWEIFIPNIVSGEYYKYEIMDQNGHIFTKQDPLAKQYEPRPGTASVVTKNLDFKWNDNNWMETRKASDPLAIPVSIYEVHLHSWDGPGLPKQKDSEFYNYRELAVALCSYVKDMGFTHVELLPVTEHPFDQSWGYQTTGYFAPTSRFGTPEDFAFFVNHMHENGIGVLIDWAPAHFPKDSSALGRFDGSALYEHLDPRLGEHQDWGTYIFNFGRNEVKNFLISSAIYWLKEFHIDGLRVDAVSSMIYLDYSREHGEWIPNEFGGNENLAAIDFIKELNILSHDLFPGSMIIAEESTAYTKVSKPIFDGGLGYTMKWNMGWMHDFLDYFGKESIHRKFHQNQITFALSYAFNENFILPLSHDEVVHGKGSLIGRMPGDIWQKFANLRCLFGLMFSHPGRKLLFMGSEIAQWREWNSNTSLDWPTLSNPQHSGIQKLIKVLNKTYQSYPCLYEDDSSYESFKWIDFSDSKQSVISFVRYNKAKDEPMLCICNFTPVVRDNYRIGSPLSGQWEIVVNSDDNEYGGSCYLKDRKFKTSEVKAHGQNQSIEIDLPPLSVIYLKLT